MKTALIISTTTRSLWNFRIPLIEALKDLGYTVDVYSIENQKNHIEKVKSLGVKVLDKLNRRSFYNIVLPYGSKPVFACRLYGLQYDSRINYVTGLGDSKQLYKILFGSICSRRSQLIWVQNKEDEMFFRSMGHKVGLIPGSGVSKRENACIKARDAGKLVFVYIGRVISKKGIDIILDLASKTEHDFRIYGGISRQEQGFLMNQDFNRIYKGFTDSWKAVYLDIIDEGNRPVCIYLSAYNEGVPRSVLEAMSIGVPTVLSNGRGTSSLNIFDDLIIQNEISFDEKLKKFLNTVDFLDKKYFEISKYEVEFVEKNFSNALVKASYKKQLESC